MSVLNIISWYISRRAGDGTWADTRQTPDTPPFTWLACLRACLCDRLLLPLYLHRAAQPESQHHIDDLHQANDNCHASHGIRVGQYFTKCFGEAPGEVGGTATNLTGLVGGQSGTAREREDLIGLVVAGSQPVTRRLQTTTLKLQGAFKGKTVS